MKNILCVALLLALFAACDDGKKQIETLKKETMAVHDEAMKDLADMNRVSRQLKEFMIVATMLPEQSEQFTAAFAKMEKVESDMMNWMSEFKEPEGVPAKEVIAYLQDQKLKIEKNRDDIRAALEAGKKLLPQGE